MFKKVVSAVLLAAILCTSFSFIALSAEENEEVVTIYVYKDGGRQLVTFPDQQAIAINGRTLVPARGLFEKLGYELIWNGADSSITVTSNLGVKVIIPIGKKVIYINGVEEPIDVPAQLINGRTMLPVRVICEAFSAIIDWSAEEKSVTISPRVR